MFLDMLRRRNPALVETAVRWHQENVLPPDTYVLDLDAIEGNARLLHETAGRLGLELYFMTKQIGRVPAAVAAIRRGGIERAVAVDAQGARLLHSQGVPIGHVGHLVQLSRVELPEILAMQPEVVTVFSVAKARQVGEAAHAQRRVQPVLVRIYGEEDVFHPLQEGGIPLPELESALAALQKVAGIEVVGFTTFPAVGLSDVEPYYAATPNLDTLLEATELARRMGFGITQVNAPGMTSVATLPLLAERGATHGEPGHALTGTTPLAPITDQPEEPAMLYLSEVSHFWQGRAYAFGGGMYPRSRVEGALVLGRGGEAAGDGAAGDGAVGDGAVGDGAAGDGAAGDSGAAVPGADGTAAAHSPRGAAQAGLRGGLLYEVEPPPAENIDYYIPLAARPDEAPLSERVRVGDTVIMSFRSQLFTLRSNVAAISGLKSGSPRLEALYRRGWSEEGSPR